MIKWEHTVCPIPDERLAIDIIRDYEKLGYELVTIYREGCYFKRPIENVSHETTKNNVIRRQIKQTEGKDWF